MPRFTFSKPITALVYADRRDVDSVLQAIVEHLTGEGFVLAGYVQRDVQPADGARCDMILEELLSGERIGISEKRGQLSRGCTLDVSELLRAAVVATRALEQRPDLMLINKFGKTETEGGGFRSLIEESIGQNVPVLIAVPARNLESWHLFSGDLAANYTIESLADDAAAICQQLGFMAAHKTVASAAIGQIPSLS